jgi:hypothetical protein
VPSVATADHHPLNQNGRHGIQTCCKHIAFIGILSCVQLCGFYCEGFFYRVSEDLESDVACPMRQSLLRAADHVAKSRFARPAIMEDARLA